MGSIKNIESPAAQRNRLISLIFKCIERVQEEINEEEEIQDLLACIILCLIGIEKTLSATTMPWEKRDYWLKVEHFNKEWDWVSKLRDELESNYIYGNYAASDNLLAHLKEILGRMKIVKIKADKFWMGCGEKYRIKKGCG